MFLLDSPSSLPDVFLKPVVAQFDAATQSSDGGLLLLGACDRQVELTDAICAEFSDRRQRGKVDHGLSDVSASGSTPSLRSRMGTTLPSCATIRVSSSATGIRETQALASQPTLSRFENAVGPREVVRALRAFEQGAIGRLSDTPRPAVS